MRIALVAAAGLVALSGCKQADSFALVHVSSIMPLSVARLHVSAQIGIATSQHDLHEGTAPTFAIPPERTFGIEIPSSYGGTLSLHVDAYDEADALLLSGDAVGDIAAGQRRDFNVVLGGEVNGGPDLAGLDLAGADLTGEPPADLTGTPQADMVQHRLILSFTNKGNTPTSTNPQGIAIGNLNADTRPDVVVACYTGGNISVLLNTGAGGLSSAGNFATGGTGQGVTIADVTGDGKQDVIAATIGLNIAVLPGVGDGTLGAASTIALSAVYSIDVAVGNLNGDTIPDIAVAAVNNTTGSKVAAIVNAPAGTYQTPTYQVAGSQPSAIKLGDFNGDGKLDFVEVNSSSSNFSIYLGVGDGTVGAPTSFGTNGAPDWVAVADFDKDGKLDVALSTAQGVEFFKGSGSGTFTGPIVSPANMQPHGIAVADFDKDGKLDVVVTNYISAGGVTVLLGAGDGHFTAQPLIPTGTNPLRLATSDLDNDGLPDIVVANASDNNVTVLLNSSQ
ncbi:MAG: repeat protein [Myxococcales bacterium]|nr:repeat protein [Myxococcales bacterium]